MRFRRVLDIVLFDIAFVYATGSVVWFLSTIIPAKAAVDTTFPTSSGVVDSIARSQIEHLRELLFAAEKLNDQRFQAIEKNVSTALNAQESATAAALQAVKEAGLKQETATERRLESVNEFRGQLKDQAATFVTRAELLATVTTAMFILIGLIGLYQRWQNKSKED